MLDTECRAASIDTASQSLHSKGRTLNPDPGTRDGIAVQIGGEVIGDRMLITDHHHHDHPEQIVV